MAPFFGSFLLLGFQGGCLSWIALLSTPTVTALRFARRCTWRGWIEFCETFRSTRALGLGRNSKVYELIYFGTLSISRLDYIPNTGRLFSIK